MNDAQIIDILAEVMRDAFRKPDLIYNPDDKLRDMFGIDSVLFVTLILTIEERFAVLLPEDKVDELSTVQSLFDLVKATAAK